MCKSDGFIVEGMKDGQLVPLATIKTEQRLFNDADLTIIVYCVNTFKGQDDIDVDGLKFVFTDNTADSEDIFVRRAFNTQEGYYKDRDKFWAYGAREQAINDIKSRIYG